MAQCDVSSSHESLTNLRKDVANVGRARLLRRLRRARAARWTTNPTSPAPPAPTTTGLRTRRRPPPPLPPSTARSTTRNGFPRTRLTWRQRRPWFPWRGRLARCPPSSLGIDYIEPFRAGFPCAHSAICNVDKFVYKMQRHSFPANQ